MTAREEIDLTAAMSELDGLDERVPIVQTPHQPKQSQPPSQPGSRSRKPLSPAPFSPQPPAPSLDDSETIHAATPLNPNRGSAQKASSLDSKPDPPLSFRPSHTPKQNQDVTPPSIFHQPVIHKTPKYQTPRKVEWTTEKIEESLRSFSREIGTIAAKLAVRLIHDAWKKEAPEPRFVSKKDWFEGMKREPVEAGTKTPDAMRIKTKQVGQGRSGKQEKREHFRVICIKTNQEPTPRYSFHHVEIRKNILSPNTMLTYVPHLRDLADNEEGIYRRWLENLETMDKTSGFATLSRHEKVVKTIQKERATMLLEHLDTWLDILSIENCTKATLIRHMANQSDTVTPQQKSSILNSYNDESGSPRSAKAVRMFTEAFDRVFNNSPELREHAVPLRDVLLLEKSVDTIVDPKKWMKDTPSQAKVAEEQTSVESFLETYALLGCLVCTSHSCEHGEYGVDNERKRFSVEVVGGLSPMIRQQMLEGARRDSPTFQKDGPPCSDECFRHLQPGTRARAWNETETMLLKTFFSSLVNSSTPVQCATAVATGRPCWDANRQLKKLGLSLPAPPLNPPIQVKPLPWYDRFKKMLIGDWQEHTNTHEHQRKDHFDPCNHDGPCDKDCPCIQNHIMCERFCRCTSAICANKFTGCACHSNGKTCMPKQKDKPCICVQLNRECDPALCGSCGARDRAMPKNADDDALYSWGCQNCALQRGKSKSVVLGKSKIAGYGLFTTEDISQDEFVIEYVGELISQDEGVRREARRGDVFDETSNSSYLFTLLEQEGIWVDAAIYGNLSRYINHQETNCNVTPRIMYVNGEYRIKFTSLREIKAGEELFFHYGENFPNLTKKLLQEEKAAKKRRKAKEQASTAEATNGEKVRKKPGRKPGRKPGPKPGRKPGRKPKKTFANIGDREEVTEDPTEEPFPDIPITKSRKRKRSGGNGQEYSDEEEYRPGITDSQDDTQSGATTAAVLSRNPPQPRPPGAKRSYMTSDRALLAEAANNMINLGPGGENGLDTPRRRARKVRRFIDEDSVRGTDDTQTTETRPIVTPKKRGRKPKSHIAQTIEAQPMAGNEIAVPENHHDSAHGSAHGSVHDSGGRFSHTQARLELDSDSGGEGVAETPTRVGNGPQINKEVAESSPLSTPETDVGYMGVEISDSDATQMKKYRRRPTSADDEYNGNSWSDSDGVRHHGAGDESDDDAELIINHQRKRRRPARFDD
ncbi:hypothetical protein F4810DRAFT_681768 [Camillea tinctor]|nr:hypothetical protein F4810DRAFT_681768 [Camillea tinctor]